MLCKGAAARASLRQLRLVWRGAARRRRGDDDRGEERGREEKKGGESTMRWGRADGGVICVGCGRWGKHGCVSVLSDASHSVRNQFRVGLGRHAYNNWILLLTISFTCSHSGLHPGLYAGVNQAAEQEIWVRAKDWRGSSTDNKLILQVILSS